jgi:small subunit ribosomal protein S4
MGDPIRLSKKYYTPRRPWDKARIVAENQLIETYGLMSKKEVWVAKTMLRKKRNSARALLAARPEQMEIGKKQLIDSLARQGILAKDANLDDVLALKVEDFLERRLQTIVFRKGLANTVKQARQFVVHGWIELDAKKINSPGYLVPKEDEEKIKYYKV